MKIHLLIYAILFYAFELSAQTRNNELKIAEDLFKNERYADAVTYFLQLLKKDNSNANLNFKTGVCYLNSRSQKSKSIYYLERAITPANIALLPSTAYKTLGDSYYLDQQPDQAIAAYEKYKSTLSAKDHVNLSTAKSEINWKIEMCKVGKKLSGENNSYSYTSFFSPDESQLILTFHKEALIKDQAYFQDFYQPNNKEIAKLSADTLLKTIANEATIGTSLDAHNILIYRNENGFSNLYTSSLDSNRWSEPQKLDRKINTKGWETGEYVSADDHTLYFTSNREGGFGGTDIYKCEKLSTGEWGKAINLGPTVNSPYDEEAPFIHPDHRTIYFSSNRYTRNKSFDILRSNYSDDSGWTFPVNVGYPLTKKNEPIHASSSSRNNKGNGLITFTDENQKHLTLLIGFAVGSTGKESPQDIKISVSDNATGDLSGIYHTKSDFLILLPEYAASDIIYEAPGYLFSIENIDFTKGNVSAYKKARYLTPINDDATVILNNIFFEQSSAKLLQNSSMELNKLVTLLSREQNLVIALSGYVSSGPTKKYNIKLSEERVQSIIEYLVMKGIDKNRVIAKNYGRSKAMLRKDESFEQLNSSFSDQKIELKIISINPKKSNLLTNQ